MVRPSGKGKRLVLLHAFTEDGWLTLDPSLHNDRVDQRARSCELVYEAEKGGGDYHDNMNGSIYVQWLTGRLLPVFAERYPGQKMVLVLDNASYHHARGTDWVNVHRMNKAAIAGKLIELGVRSISGQRQKKGTQTMENFHFEADTFARRGGRYAPTLAELKVELQAYLTVHPQHNRTEVSKLMTQHKHELIYTPPTFRASSPSNGCGRTSRITWQLSTGQAGPCVNLFDRPMKASTGMVTSMWGSMPGCVPVSSSTRTPSATISSSRTTR